MELLGDVAKRLLKIARESQIKRKQPKPIPLDPELRRITDDAEWMMKHYREILPFKAPARVPLDESLINDWPPFDLFHSFPCRKEKS